jgi:hypothetical protein
MSSIPPPECVTTAGVMAAGNVVGFALTDNLDLARRAEAALHAKLRTELFAVDPAVRFRTWIDRGQIRGPAGEMIHGAGYRLNFSVRDGIENPKLRSVIEAQDTTFAGLELWHHIWSPEAPETIL